MSVKFIKISSFIEKTNLGKVNNALKIQDENWNLVCKINSEIWTSIKMADVVYEKWIKLGLKEFLTESNKL